VTLRCSTAAPPERVIVIGDAQWSPDPLSGFGITKALRSAIAAWRTISAPLGEQTDASALALRHLAERSALFPMDGSLGFYQRRNGASRRLQEVFGGNSMGMV